MITLKDIKDYQLKSMAHYTPTDFSNDHPYDEDGHCSDSGWMEILNFWQEFDTDKDFKYLVSGKWFSDDIDLGGGRSYLLGDDKLIDMLFDYMYNTLKWSREDFDKIIYNSTELSDELYDRYDDPSVIRDIRLDGVLNETPKEEHKTKNLWDGFDFDKISEEIDEMKNVELIPLFVKYPKKKKNILDKFDTIEYIKESVEDSNLLIYKIKSLGVEIPSGYTVVQPIKKLI